MSRIRATGSNRPAHRPGSRPGRPSAGLRRFAGDSIRLGETPTRRDGLVDVRRTLLLTNDFPPRTGGIQSYLHELAIRLPAADLVVYAPDWPGAAEFDAALPFPVIRHPTSLMLPVPTVERRAARLIRDHGLEAVWFGASAPLALLAPRLRRAGITRVLACTHGHEVGWSMLPGSRQALRRIGSNADVITFISYYSRRRISAALGPRAALELVSPGVDVTVFRPDPGAGRAVRECHGLQDRPVVVCTSRLVRRKGQDTLIRAWPRVLERVPEAMLLLVGDGPREAALRRMITGRGLQDRVVLTGRVAADRLPAHYAAGDAFAMPCRTRGRGLDVEGLGIVFLEASAVGLPVVAGDSGGAPETVRDQQSGIVVDGHDVAEVAQAVIEVLADRRRARQMGRTGRAWVERDWGWQDSADRLAALLSG